MAETQQLRAGIMGWPLDHTLSPRLHGFWLKAYGIDGRYDVLPVKSEDLGAALKGLAASGLRGVNLTLPHKHTSIKFLDELDGSAKKVGAVNTVVLRADGRCEGRNTDAFGFANSLKECGYKPGGKRAVVLGSGGAAFAAVAALADLGVNAISVINRTEARAEILRRHFAGVFPSLEVASHGLADLAEPLSNAEILVNATSLGMKGQPPLAISIDPLPRDALVADMVYAPLQTDLLIEARRRGHPICDGLGMLLHQARPAFAAFYGHDAEVSDALRRFVLEGN